MDKITADNLRFIDEYGRTRLFNGMNIDDKLLDRDTFRYDLDADFFEKYRMYGFDFIRLAVTWQNLEPVMGEYNESYLASIDRIFDLAEKYGVYILLDIHQDLYTGYDGEGVGDGAPSWACLSSGARPKMPKFVWGEGYVFGKFVHRCFDSFWENSPVDGIGLQDRFACLWQMLARRYAGRSAFFGFDLLNEPFPGMQGKKMVRRLALSAVRTVAFSRKIKKTAIVKAVLKKDMAGLLDSVGGNVVRDVMKNLDSLSEKFDTLRYTPFLNKISSAIREVTSEGIIMIEQSFMCNGGVRHYAGPVTVNGSRDSQQCFGPHSYDMTVDTPLYKYANAGRVKAFFSEMKNTQLRLNVPVIVGEWGGCSDNKDTSWFPHAHELLNFFDENHWSQAYWDYHGDDMESPLMSLLSRTHPVAVDGEIISYGFDYEKNIFSLVYDPAGESGTVVYTHRPFDKIEGGSPEIIAEYKNGAKLLLFKACKERQTLKIFFGVNYGTD